MPALAQEPSPTTSPADKAAALASPADKTAAVASPSVWPAGWRFRLSVNASEAAKNYALTIQHDGLATSDARDVRVVNAAGEPVSLLIVQADPAVCRLLFDGGGGPGLFYVYLGNISSKQLPPVPRGVSAFGRRDWSPTGGFTCVSMDPIEKIEPDTLISGPAVRDAFDRAGQRITSAVEAELTAQPDPTKRRKFLLRSIHRSSDTLITNIEASELLRDASAPPVTIPQNWLHIFHMQIDVKVAGTYDFVTNNGQPAPTFGVLIVDNNWDKPAVAGWYTASSGGASVIDVIGKAELSPGAHKLAFYTNRPNPDVRWTLSGSGAIADPITGKHAHFDDTAEVSSGDFEIGAGDLFDAYLASIRDWSTQGRFASARNLNRIARARFGSDPTRLEQLTRVYEEAEAKAFERNWLMEGKYPTRSGYVAAPPDFGPPFNAPTVVADNLLHDQRHMSSAVAVEGNVVYGLPVYVEDTPWAVTSGICAGDDLLYVGTKNGVMHAVSLSASAQRWTFPAGGSCLSGPLLYGENLYFTSLDRRLYALDAQRGRMLWNFPSKGWIDGGPCATGGKIFFASRDRHLYAIDAILGIERWRVDLGAEAIATPCTDGQRIFIGTRDGTFFAVDAGAGTVLWKYTAGAPIVAGACVGTARVTFGDTAGLLHSLDVETGKLAWPAPVALAEPIHAAPILVGGTIYGGCAVGKLFGIDLVSGNVVWTETMPSGGGVTRQPLLIDQKLIFVSQSREVRLPDGRMELARGVVATFEPLREKPVSK